MINKIALINQHIYEIEKLRHDLIVTQTKNGLYLSEDRRAEIRHKSESKSGNLVDSRRKIDWLVTGLAWLCTADRKEKDCYGSIKTGGMAHKTQSPETGYKTEGTVAGQGRATAAGSISLRWNHSLVLEFSGEKRVSLTNPVVVVVGEPVLEEELSGSVQIHSLIDFETSDDDEVIARGPLMLLTKTERAREPSKSSEQIKREARVRVRGVILSS
ncbi:hypothetical protein PPACK8108_LOCUS19268 [Phakopsora pachyrhizi]|uniref:Uncharacterized protein n=1 Tax=Phakopsora pachyrhizi TaxID=170000 RepID=A0AAV0BD92_PHAPC|nr:hypothetical protein PPACK8108_LOCUS19268 [Phakopsora pachyrhizi]